jgi:hypothetical protein
MLLTSYLKGYRSGKRVKTNLHFVIRLVKLLEADVVGVFPEALTAHVQVVLPEIRKKKAFQVCF